MEAAYISVAISVGSVLVGVGIFIGRTKSMGKDIAELDRAVHKHGNRLALIPEKPDDVYVRKDALAPALKAIDESLKRIEEQQQAIANGLIRGSA